MNKHHLIFAALGGVFGYGVYQMLQTLNVSHAGALFIATCVFATYAEIMARVRKTTVTTFSIVALIPFVPGGALYLTMLAVVNDDLFRAIELGVSVMADACILALGILMVSTVTHFIKTLYRNR